MALALADWKSRINTDLRMVLGSSGDQLQTDIIVRAARRFVRRMDEPIISATLAVNATTGAGPYNVPTTLRKLVDVRDAQSTPASQPYSYDSTKNQITFEDAATASENWTAYGTPKSTRTNISTILAAVSEDHEDVLWAYVEAEAYLWAHHSEAYQRLKFADEQADEERMSRNRMLDATGVPLQYRDVQGDRIGELYNAEGFDVDLSDNLAMDLGE